MKLLVILLNRICYA